MKPSYELRVALDDLAKAADHLNALSVQLNQFFTEVEEKLNAMGVGVTVWLDVTESENWQIGYAKLKGVWCLVAREGSDASASTVALRSAPRLVRVEAVPRLEELVAALRARVQELAESLAGLPRIM